MTQILNFKINFKYVSVLVFISVIATYFITQYFFVDKISETSTTVANTLQVKRLEGYHYVKPLLYVDQDESSDLTSMKAEVQNIIQAFQQKNVIKSASVYLIDYNTNDWMGINLEEKFKPGSLLKVPELIAFLKMNEKNPGLLDKKILFNKIYKADKKPLFTSKSIEFGQSYTIRELLYYMIVYSDNNATYLLNDNIDVEVFKNVFTDLGLAAPDWNATDYFITSYEISLFMRALYNASYLTIKDSEYAASLLSKSNFKQGVLAGIPSNNDFFHKFGEAGDAVEKQLHETVVVYTQNKAYLLTIMTKGNDFKTLPEVLKQISAAVYRNLAGQAQQAL